MGVENVWKSNRLRFLPRPFGLNYVHIFISNSQNFGN